MRPRTLLALVAVGVIALGGGWYYGVATAPSEQDSVNSGKLMFPGLTAELPKAQKVEIVSQGKPLTIERHGGTWGLTDRSLYPVQETKLRSMFTALTELRLVEPRTSDPKQYSILGVEDPTATDTNGTADLLRLVDGTGKPILSLIVGHRRVRTQGDVPDQVYVRRPGHKQSWLADGGLQVDADPQTWLDRDIMNLDHAQIAKVVSTEGNSTVELDRDGDKLVLQRPAEHPKLDDYKLADVSRALELLTFEDVHKTDDRAGSPAGHSVFTTTNGMTVAITVFHPSVTDPSKPTGDRHILVRFEVAGTGKSESQASRLEHKLSGWTYTLGAWKEHALLPSVATLKASDDTAAHAGAKP